MGWGEGRSCFQVAGNERCRGPVPSLCFAGVLVLLLLSSRRVNHGCPMMENKVFFNYYYITFVSLWPIKPSQKLYKGEEVSLRWWFRLSQVILTGTGGRAILSEIIEVCGRDCDRQTREQRPGPEPVELSKPIPRALPPPARSHLLLKGFTASTRHCHPLGNRHSKHFRFKP